MLDGGKENMSEWEKQSDRETVKTLLAMGFIPTWLEELLIEGDKMQKNMQFLQKSVDVLSAVRGDWLTKYNDMCVSLEQLQEANRDLAQLVYDRTEKLDAIRTKLRWLLENGYVKSCETDIRELLDDE